VQASSAVKPQSSKLEIVQGASKLSIYKLIHFQASKNRTSVDHHNNETEESRNKIHGAQHDTVYYTKEESSIF
jgi:hypothetical protein